MSEAAQSGHAWPPDTGAAVLSVLTRTVSNMDFKLELVVVPVTDVDRAKDFYVRAGFSADVDQTMSEQLRFVQLTPPGSACSIAIGTGLSSTPPGTLDGLQVVVADAAAARDELLGRGVDVSEVEVLPWGSFVRFSDPDGNQWSVQQLPNWSRGVGGSGDSSEGWSG
jgi:catechol 2,3-dioxygenase-like lactoylglutathione lyase family enzyme